MHCTFTLPQCTLIYKDNLFLDTHVGDFDTKAKKKICKSIQKYVLQSESDDLSLFKSSA